MTETKGFIHAAATTALDTRKADRAKLVANRIGVIGPNPSIVTSDPSTSPIRVAVAEAGFATLRATGDGAAVWTNDGSIFLTITKPGSNSHYVVVYAKHNDAAAGDGSNTPTLGTVTGTPAASPTEPALPAGALKLATILVPSTATSSQSAGVVITNVYPMTAYAGGSVPFRTYTELIAWSSGVPTGQRATVIADSTDALNGDYLWSGSAWIAASTRMAQGNGVIVGSALPAGAHIITQGGSVIASVNTAGDGMNALFGTPFPNGVFSFVAMSGDASLAGRVLGAVNVTLTGAGIKWEGIPSTGNRRANWIAMGW